ncbi:FAD-dependent oxidoreductase [Ruegeria sp. 2205SS24-7]|uniref:NAD(P)/FAD-dependent oxidoreductase n=1 Tax=Ruegeria discodermiae TaxID=3064389 RepID=UPI0027422416|nr:FAD-dependent oxidoreductase [Ruegeria sp. 2205SS24-7]MDP5218916.1 FAD-dependent oxidoreductase [Ruegeria sp. 2205SS24-7]
MSGIVIVGAGHAGLRAATSARRSGFEGPITLIDRDAVWPPHERPPLSKWREDGVEARHIIPAEHVDAAELTFQRDQVEAIDPGARSLTLSDGAILGFDKLLLATGAGARAFRDAMTLRTKADADAIRERAADAESAIIVGAGFIGLELASSLRTMGVAVRVVEKADRILARGATPAVAAIVQNRHVAAGVAFSLNHSVTPEELVQADLVIAGVGSAPVVELAEQAGLSVDNGILVDRHLCTSHPDIFAAGDCCAVPVLGEQPTRLEAWTAAGQQGDIAGHNMTCSDDLRSCELTPWLWLNQYDYVLQSAGLQKPDHQIIDRAYGPDHHISFGLSDGKLSFAVGVARGVKIAKDMRFAMKLIESARSGQHGPRRSGHCTQKSAQGIGPE